ncbi:Phosphatidylinositol transfer protein 2, partial [Clarias magur]
FASCSSYQRRLMHTPICLTQKTHPSASLKDTFICLIQRHAHLPHSASKTCPFASLCLTRSSVSFKDTPICLTQKTCPFASLKDSKDICLFQSRHIPSRHASLKDTFICLIQRHTHLPHSKDMSICLTQRHVHLSHSKTHPSASL